VLNSISNNIRKLQSMTLHLKQCSDHLLSLLFKFSFSIKSFTQKFLLYTYSKSLYCKTQKTPVCTILSCNVSNTIPNSRMSNSSNNGPNSLALARCMIARINQNSWDYTYSTKQKRAIHLK
jgi:hypothetical protein